MQDTVGDALERWQASAASGDWRPLLEILAEDVTFIVPSGDHVGLNRGRERARAFFTGLSAVLRSRITVRRVLRSGDTAACELSVRGTLQGQEFAQMLMLVLTVRDGQVSEFHEFVAWPGGAAPDTDLDTMWP